MERASIDMKTLTAKCSEKMYFGAKVYRKLLSESTKNAYDVYIAKLHVMQVF